MFYFTSPYPDEFFASIVARYHRRSGYTDFIHTIIDIFGRKTHMNFHSIGNIDYLCDQLPRELNYSKDIFINQHTIYPFYFAFVSLDRRNKILEENCSSNNVHNSRANFKVKNETSYFKEGIKFCSSCIQDDIAKFGQAYIHRIHQVPGYFICIKHNKVLQYNYNFQNGIYFDEITIDKLVDGNSIIERLYDYFFNIAHDIQYLFEFFNNDDIEIRNVLKKYLSLLKQQGYTNYSGVINYQRLYNDISSFYPIDFLNVLGLNVEYLRSDWLKRITKVSCGFVHPLGHLLLIRFLFGSMERFLNYEEVNFFTQHGPYPCKNPVAQHYNEKVIEQFVVRRDGKTGGLYGVFECECGFIYSHKISKEGKVNFEKISKVIQQGDMWNERMKGYIASGNYTYVQLTKMMGCSAGKIKRFKRKMRGVYLSESKHQESVGTYRENPKVSLEAQYKKELLRYIEDNPTVQTIQLRKDMSKQEHWLRKHCNEFFIETMHRRREAIKNSEDVCKIDWVKRDGEINNKLIQSINFILGEDKPKWLSIKAIVEKSNLKYNWLLKNLSNLPICKLTLEKNAETVEAFQIRKINITLEKMINEGLKISKTALMKQAHVKFDTKSEGVHTAIDRILFEPLE